ncbi:MAG: WD40 repeat domain-containing protein, partial [Chloroflexota bacterium]
VSGDLAPSDYIEIGSHNSKIRNLEVSADGTQLLSASEDGTIRLWSLDAPRLPIKTFAGHLNFVFDAIFFNQEEFIISASQDRSIRLWDIENKFTSVFMSHTVPLHALAVNNNTNLIATADTNGTVYWWDMRQFDQEPNILLLEEEGHDGFVQALAFEPNQRILASAGREGSIIIWDLIRSNPIQQIPEAHDDSIRSLAYSPDGSYLASSSFDETVKIWDMETPSQEPIKILRDHNEDVRTLIFHPDGAWLATGAWDGRIILWNWETGDTVMWEEHTASVRSLTITPDGNVLVSADRGGIIKMWDISGIVENNELVEPKVYHDALVTYGGSVDAIMFSPDSRYLYSAGEDKSILVWDWANLNQPPLSMSTAHKLPIVKIQYLEETNQIMSLSEDGQIWKTQLIENFAKEVCDQIIQPLTEQEYQEIVGENEIDRPISCQSEP